MQSYLNDWRTSSLYDAIDRVVVESSRMAGGPHCSFRGMEWYGSELPNYSAVRDCVRLDAGGVVRGSFLWTGSADRRRRYVFRFRGMWDFYRDIRIGSILSHRDMRTRGVFRVALNGVTIFRGMVHYFNFRRWRFWPAVEVALDPGLLARGTNTFEIHNLTPPFQPMPTAQVEIPVALRRNTAYQVSDVQIASCPERGDASMRALPAGTYLGHLIGHEAVYREGEDYAALINQFQAEEQGNLLVWMFSPKWYDIDPDRIDVEAILKRRDYVAIRLVEPDVLRSPGLRRLIKRLGPHFIGGGFHEGWSHMMTLAADQSAQTLPAMIASFVDHMRRKIRACRKGGGRAPVWVTDPSFYQRYYMMAGASFPAIEVCGTHAPLIIDSARGTAKAFGVDRWVAINAWDCQCFGGLSLYSQHAALMPRFEEKRLKLWRLSQFYLYLAGARTIYSESGAYNAKVTVERERDDPVLIRVRSAQRALARFACRYRLQGQPLTTMALLQGRNDITSVAISRDLFKVTGYAPYSWMAAEVFYPDFTMEVSREYAVNFERAGRPRQESFSDAPYGEVDIVPVEGALACYNRYKLMVMAGWNTMTPDALRKLSAYVRQGGTLMVLLPHMTRATDVKDPCAAIPASWLLTLCGVALEPEGPAAHVPLNGLTIRARERSRWPETAKIIRQQPADPFYLHRSTFNAFVRTLRLKAPTAESVMDETFSGVPFLVRNRVGRGQVYLAALGFYPNAPTVYHVVNALIRDVANRLPRAVRLVAGENINYFVYPSAVRGERCRIFVLRNDWYARDRETRVIFEVYGKRVELAMKPNAVGVVTVFRSNLRAVEYHSMEGNAGL